jgi:hypothetical protein
LQVKPREVGAFQSPELSLSLSDDGALLHGNRVGCRVQSRDVLLRWQLKQSRSGDEGLGGLRSNELTQGSAGYVPGPLSLYELSACGGKLRFGARPVRPRAQLGVHQGVGGLADRLGPIHSGLRGADGLLNGDQRQVGIRGFDRDLELGAFQRRLRPGPRGLGCGIVRAPQAKIERFPAHQRSDGATPCRSEVVRAQHRAGNRGDDALRQ